VFQFKLPELLVLLPYVLGVAAGEGFPGITTGFWVAAPGGPGYTLGLGMNAPPMLLFDIVTIPGCPATLLMVTPGGRLYEDPRSSPSYTIAVTLLLLLLPLLLSLVSLFPLLVLLVLLDPPAPPFFFLAFLLLFLFPVFPVDI